MWRASARWSYVEVRDALEVRVLRAVEVLGSLQRDQYVPVATFRYLLLLTTITPSRKRYS